MSKIKNIASILLIGLICFTNVSTSYAKTFIDVPDSQVFKIYIDDLVERNIVNGFSDNTFRPDNYVTRGELAKFVVNAFKLESNFPTNKFSDINESTTFYNEILILADNGVINGYTDGTFKPQNIVTRGDSMKFIVKAAQLNYPEIFSEYSELQLFSDITTDYVYFEYINAAASIELNDGTRIINGFADKSFGKSYAITRGAMAKIISATLDYIENGGEYNPPSAFNVITDDVSSPTSINIDEFEYFARYDVEDDDISLYLKDTGAEVDKYQEIWNMFTKIVPREYRTEVNGFDVYTDGVDNTIAAVYRNENDVNKWILAVDKNDIFVNGKIDEYTLQYAFIHELNHLIVLDNDQIEFIEDMFYVETEEEFFRLYEKERLNCETYFTTFGCSNSNSYMYAFFEKYWEDKYDEYLRISNITDEDEYFSELRDFYNSYPNEFVTEYAVSEPEEDIAESFTTFVLDKKPLSDLTVKNQKVLFFYEYPELVALRNSIRSEIY